jgi:hypothetical protein
VIGLLTSQRHNPSQSAPTNHDSKSTGVVFNFYEQRPRFISSTTKRPCTADSQIGPLASFPAPSPNVTSPFSVSDTRYESALNEYGSWLEYRCSTERWRTQVRLAVAACDSEFLCLKYAVKMPLDWWQKQGIPDGISRLFCDNVKRWVKWRTVETGKVRKVQITDDFLDGGVAKYHVVTMDPAEELSADLTTSSGQGRLQFSDAHVGELPIEDEDVELNELLVADGRCELEKMLHEEEQFEQPVGSPLRMRFSDFVGQTLQDFNNSESL